MRDGLVVRGSSGGDRLIVLEPDVQEAKRLALSVELEGNARLADELFERLEMGFGVPIAEFENTEIDGLISKISRLDKLDDPGRKNAPLAHI